MTASTPERPIPHPSDMPFPDLGPHHLASPRLWQPTEVSVLPGARSFLGLTSARPLGWRPLLLDLHLPAAPSGPVPVVAYAHGGSMVGGVREMGPWASLPGHGIAVASFDYRLAGEVRYPDAIEDLRAGLAWLGVHGADYGLDPSRIVAWGSSSGGYLMARAALSPGTPIGRPVGEPHHVEVSALVLHYAPVDFASLLEDTMERSPAADGMVVDVVSQFFGVQMVQALDMIRGASVLAAVRAASMVPPTYISHGDADRRCALAQSERLVEAVRGRGGTALLDVVAGAGHADPVFASPRVIVPTVEFLRRTWAAGPPTTASATSPQAEADTRQHRPASTD